MDFSLAVRFGPPVTWLAADAYPGEAPRPLQFTHEKHTMTPPPAEEFLRPAQSSRSAADSEPAKRSGDIRATADSATLAALLEASGDDRSERNETPPWAAKLGDADRRRLLAVARAAGPLKLDAADVRALIRAVLPDTLVAMAADEASRERLVGQIAASLLEDPNSRERLQALVAALNSVKQRALE